MAKMSAYKLMSTTVFDGDFERATATWDPFAVDMSNNVPTATATYRLKKDLMSIFAEPPPGLFVYSDEQDLMLVHAIIVGPMETPYEGGFFYFVLRCPNNYPIEPPKVKLMTTDAGKVRFNPNLYRSGKICLSILGTWEGPAWSPAQQIASLMVSIQSLLNEKPYFNEPGITMEQRPGDNQTYNQIIQHETLRVAVCGMLENDTHLCLPLSLRRIIEKNFLAFYEQYVATVHKYKHLDGRKMMDPFGGDRGVYDFKRSLNRMEQLHKIISEKFKDEDVKPSTSNTSI